MGTPSHLSGRAALVAVYGATFLLLAASFALSRATDRPFSDFSRDAIRVVGDAPIYVGVLSNVGVLLWAAAAAACLVAGETLRRLSDPFAGLLLGAGATSALLACDDLFIVHEKLDERVGVPQPLTVAAYAALVAWVLYRYRELVRRTEWKLLAAALVLFVASAILDGLAEETTVLGATTLEGFEDSLKLVGIVTWTAYWARTAVLALLRATPTPEGAGVTLRS
jgi:hypothetical protein